IETGGTANAQTLTSNQTLTALTNGFEITFRVGAGLTNTATATLAVDSLTAKTIQGINGTNLAGGELVAGGTYTVTYFATADKWLLHNFNCPVLGTWTPAFTGSSSNPTVGYSSRTGTYTRVGNLVSASAELTLSSASGGSGNAQFSLPFAIYGSSAHIL